MSFEVIWSRSAEHRLSDIVSFYTEHFSEAAAFALARKLLKSTIHLQNTPHVGQCEPLLQDCKLEYRYVVEGDFKVLYTINEQLEQVRVADVFDCRQDPSRLQKIL